MYSRHFPPQPNPYRYAYPMRSPLSLLGLGITVCGAIALCSVIAPDLLEMKLPGWRERFGYLVMIGVSLGLLRSVWRTMIPLISVGFWVVALFCLWKPTFTGALQQVAPSLATPSLSATNNTQPAQAIPVSLPKSGRLGSALPHDAYFAKPYGSRGGIAIPTSLSQAKGSIGRLLGGL